MTAEIAIINRHAIALAADSAVTVGRDKVWKTANKLFSLGPDHDIAIMVYGAGDFLGLTWESIIKEFRRRCASDTFATVSDCTAAFKSFLVTSKMFTRPDQELYSVLFPVFDIINEIEDSATDEEIQQGAIDRSAFFREQSSGIVVDAHEFAGTLRGELVAFCANKFGRKLSDKLTKRSIALAVDFFQSQIPSQYHSGVVIAGFGSEEYHPALSHHIVDGRWKGVLRWWDGGQGKNLNTTDHHDESPIVPFAQDDVSFQFMTGISIDYLSFLRAGLEDLMRAAFEQFTDEFVDPKRRENATERSAETAREFSRAVMDQLMKKVRTEQYLPINQAVGALPKEEMALVAEALVDLTSLKRKVDSPVESVGGPVDVAVISKGDGFIWIKRKFYFDPAKNSEFFERKRRRDGVRQ